MSKSSKELQYKIDTYLDAKYASSLIKKYRFIRDDIFLVFYVSKGRDKLFLDFHKIKGDMQWWKTWNCGEITGIVEIFDELDCTHSVLIKIPYDCRVEIMKDPDKFKKFAEDLFRIGERFENIDDEGDWEEEDFETDIEEDWGEVSRKESLTFQRWVQGIAELGLDAPKCLSEIDSLSDAFLNWLDGIKNANYDEFDKDYMLDTVYMFTYPAPIAQFIIKNLIRVDPKFLMEFLIKSEKESRSEGGHDLPSLRANLTVALEAISQLDLFDETYFNERDFYDPRMRRYDRFLQIEEEEEYLFPIDEGTRTAIIGCIRFIAELDSGFLTNFNNNRIRHFLDLHPV